MKLLMIFVDEDRSGDVETVLEAADVPGYSEFPRVLGKGLTGRKQGTRAFPGSSVMYLAAVPLQKVSDVVSSLQTLQEVKGPDEGLRVYSVDTDLLL